jgi:hypothetical protein
MKVMAIRLRVGRGIELSFPRVAPDPNSEHRASFAVGGSFALTHLKIFLAGQCRLFIFVSEPRYPTVR